FVSVLPLFHTFECTCGLLMPLYSGARIIYAPSLKSRDIIRAIREGEGTIMLGVPLLFEKLLAGIHGAIKKQPAFKRAAFRASLGLVKLGRAILKGRWGKGIFRGLRDKAGLARLRLMFSGAAALDPNVARGFENLGLLLVQGYGLTETSPVTNGNHPDFESAVPETIGPCLWGTEVLVRDPDEHGHGELCYRGPQVMPGYLDNPRADEAVFIDAPIPGDGELEDRRLYAAGPGVEETPESERGRWFRTGDIGWIGADGHPRIAGRSKNVIVTAAGKNVYPEQIEEQLSRSPFVAECVVMGRRVEGSNREDVIAVIVPDYEHFDLAAREKGYELNENKIRETLRREVMRTNDELASFKRIKDFVVREEEFPKTSTKKIKRYLLGADYLGAPRR
ncbi:MAG: AMP-binding protein, partial [Candidatus Coatesbacteria bacterium]|nr:AMP-binding protein [Candidatus Coatesbacteria bacterium]